MIEFNGYLSGLAEERFRSKARLLAQNMLLIGFAALVPGIVYFAVTMGSWKLVWAYGSLFVIIPLLVRIPKRKKEWLAITPKKIYVEEEYIVCVADRYTESRTIDDVKKVIDHGEFYELIFYFGKISEKYICQKCLLTKGSLEEFEALFGDKLLRGC